MAGCVGKIVYPAVLKEIMPAVCALLNSNGGKVVFHLDISTSSTQRQRMSVIRKLEQSMISVIGIQLTAWNINFKEDKESIVILVEKAKSLVTTSYNFCLPSQTQVVQVSPLQPLEKIRDDIIKRKVVPEAAQLGSHCKVFHKGNDCGFPESKFNQFKYLKANQSKRTRLPDRMTCKGNKFNCYASAFANYQGGHIYYGITDDGIVEGEFISSEQKKSEITTKVEKCVKKMIWPLQIGQPKRGVHWEIFFEPVVDENNGGIQSTFVIVVYIAPCLGGVFTEEPECYEMVKGKVEKMSFATWKRRILEPVETIRSESSVTDQRKNELNFRYPTTQSNPGEAVPTTQSNPGEAVPTTQSNPSEAVPHPIPRIQWSSDETKQICTCASDALMEVINNGNWKELDRKAKWYQEKYPQNDELNLIVLSKIVIAYSRQGLFKNAQDTLSIFHEMLPKVNNTAFFDALGSYLKVVLKRNQRCFEGIEELLTDILTKSDVIEAGFLTAAIHTLVATVSSYKDGESGLSQPQDELCRKAIEHLRRVVGPSSVTWDMEQKAYITLTFYYLKCVLSNDLILPEKCEAADLELAKSAFTAFNNSKQENPPSRYRQIQSKLAEAVSYYRQSQVEEGKKKQLLECALNFANDAKELAKSLRFEEMVCWSNTLISECTTALVYSALKSSVKPGLELSVRFHLN